MIVILGLAGGFSDPSMRAAKKYKLYAKWLPYRFPVVSEYIKYNIVDIKTDPSFAQNLKSATEFHQVLLQTLESELSAGRIRGPFSSPPFFNLRVSPLGVVPKKEPGKFRLIQHLSHPKGSSVNDGISEADATVTYVSFDRAVSLVRQAGRGALMAKSDIESAFRLLPVHPDCHHLLGWFVDGSYYYDTCLPMGCSISCYYFELFSSFLEWVVRWDSGSHSITHYLDDFLFVGPSDSPQCQFLLDNFCRLMEKFGVPLSQGKTVGPVSTLSFLGIEIDSKAMIFRLPSDKVSALLSLLMGFRSVRSVTLRQMQSLLGLLVFACRVMPMGRIFSRRLALATREISRALPSRSAGQLALPCQYVEPPSQQLIPLVRASVAPATWQAYGKAWSEWLIFAGHPPIDSSEPARLAATVRYLIHLRDSGFSGSVARNRLTGIAFHFKLRGWSDITKSFIISRAVRGWCRLTPCQEHRRPISFALLARLIGAVHNFCSSFESALFAVSFGLAFFGALRIGELLSLSRHRPGGLRHNDVTVSNGGLRIRIRKSKKKTDPSGRGSWIPLFATPGPVCPIVLVNNYLAVHRSGVSFLSHEDGSPLTKFQFLALFRKCLRSFGLKPTDFGTHSFRIGAATEAARAGLSNSEIQRIGRWRSSCFARYVRPDLLLY
ncbi:LOW QUALITY PROTEIN: uncharacterized protein ACNLHF_019259 [Anomaloglossus baeobatrachus]